MQKDGGIFHKEISKHKGRKHADNDEDSMQEQEEGLSELVDREEEYKGEYCKSDTDSGEQKELEIAERGKKMLK